MRKNAVESLGGPLEVHKNAENNGNDAKGKIQFFEILIRTMFSVFLRI